MIREGQVVLFRFPQTDGPEGKLRPALAIRRLPGPYDDWLICMVSSQLRHAIAEFDEVISEPHDDFKPSGLKTSSVIRIGRLAVVHAGVLLGPIGQIDDSRLQRIRKNLSDWLTGE